MCFVVLSDEKVKTDSLINVTLRMTKHLTLCAIEKQENKLKPLG